MKRKSSKPKAKQKSKPSSKKFAEKASSSSVELRLQKFLSEAGVTSRRKAEDLIRAGLVRVNGRSVTELGTKINPAKDSVEVRGKPVRAQEKLLFCFHKPSQVVSTLADPHGRKCVRDFLKGVGARLYPIGRLDYDVAGLLLLTNDGDYMERILHPRFEVERVYWARVKGKVEPSKLELLRKGIELEDGPGKAVRAKRLEESKALLELLGPGQGNVPHEYIEVAVREGRNHFVKRLLAAVDLPVVRLSRVSFGPFSLTDLRPGKLRKVDFAQL